MDTKFSGPPAHIVPSREVKTESTSSMGSPSRPVKLILTGEISKAINAPACGNPQVTFVVLIESIDEIARKTVCNPEVIDGVAVNPITSLRFCSYPQGFLPIQKQSVND